MFFFSWQQKIIIFLQKIESRSQSEQIISNHLPPPSEIFAKLEGGDDWEATQDSL